MRLHLSCSCFRTTFVRVGATVALYILEIFMPDSTKARDARTRTAPTPRDARAEKRGSLSSPASSPRRKKCCHESSEAKRCPYQERTIRSMVQFESLFHSFQSLRESMHVQQRMCDERLREKDEENMIIWAALGESEAKFSALRAKLSAALGSAAAAARAHENIHAQRKLFPSVSPVAQVASKRRDDSLSRDGQ